jgi:hypothetical protein
MTKVNVSLRSIYFFSSKKVPRQRRTTTLGTLGTSYFSHFDYFLLFTGNILPGSFHYLLLTTYYLLLSPSHMELSLC